jgi:hypothetical protein
MAFTRIHTTPHSTKRRHGSIGRREGEVRYEARRAERKSRSGPAANVGGVGSGVQRRRVGWCCRARRSSAPTTRGHWHKHQPGQHFLRRDHDRPIIASTVCKTLAVCQAFAVEHLALRLRFAGGSGHDRGPLSLGCPVRGLRGEGAGSFPPPVFGESGYFKDKHWRRGITMFRPQLQPLHPEA